MLLQAGDAFQAAARAGALVLLAVPLLLSKPQKYVKY